ncbi:Sec-independent protein translocase subunit TatA/TatB [Nitratifractor sp.]
MGMPSMPELLVILAIVVLLFGAKKIPELAKGVGKGVKEFKKAINEEDEEPKEAPKELTKEAETSAPQKTETKSAENA